MSNIKYIVSTCTHHHPYRDVYSLKRGTWFTSSVITANSIDIPTRNHLNETLLLLSLGLGKQEIEEHFNIGK